MVIVFRFVVFLVVLLATTHASARIDDTRLASGPASTCLHDACKRARAKSASPTKKSSIEEQTRVGSRFTGKEEDIEVGLTYFGARYYQAHLGRWASADPLTIHRLGSDLNPYAYVRGRVTSHIDPFGLDDCVVWASSSSGDGGKTSGSTTVTGKCSSRNDFDHTKGTNPILNRMFGSPSQQIANQTFTLQGQQALSQNQPGSSRGPVRDRPFRAATVPAALWNTTIDHLIGSVVTALLQDAREPEYDNPAYDGVYWGGFGLSMFGPGFAGRIGRLFAPLAEGAGGGSGYVIMYHGTTRSSAWNIMRNGFRPGRDGAVFFATEGTTARHFAQEAIAARGAKTGTVLKFRLSLDTFKRLGIQTMYLGEYRGAPLLDIPGGSGSEYVLERAGGFNYALENGLITVEAVGPIR